MVYAERDCYRDLDEMGALTWIDALYYATVTLSTTGYGDITPVCESARLANVLIITPLRFLFLIVLVGTTIEVLTQRTREQVRSNRWRSNVHDHTVIIGYGVKGRAAARVTRRRRHLARRRSSSSPTTDRPSTRPRATGSSESSATDGARTCCVTPRSSGPSRIVVATDEDDTSILVTLTARRLSPNATIVAAVREAQNTEILRQSGSEQRHPDGRVGGSAHGPVAPVQHRR